MRSIATSFIIGWTLIIIGGIAAAAIIISNVVSGINNGWTGGNVGWIIGAVIGFFLWEVVAAIITFASTTRAMSRF